jgi:RNA polymerase sigma factor (sigma-70 family)
MKKEDERYTQQLSREIDTAFEHYKPDDPSTHEALHAAFRAQARNVIYYRLGKYDDVLEYDIVSRAMVALPSFRGASKLSTWFYTIAQREGYRALEKLIEDRNRYVQIIEDEDDGEDRPSNAIPTDELQAKSVDQTTKLSVDALEKHLPKEQRKVFALWRSGLTLEQVAEKTGKALGTVLFLHDAAKKNMRKAASGASKKRGA